MKRAETWRAAGLAALILGLAALLAACELEFGNSGKGTGTGGDSTPTGTVNTGGTDKTDGGGKPTPVVPGGTTAPGVPRAISPDEGEKFSGAGAEVTFEWTDAEGAAEFEVLVQGLAAGGWRPAARTVTDNFAFTLALAGQPYSQFRWTVRSLSASSTPSAFTAWLSFSWSP